MEFIIGLLIGGTIGAIVMCCLFTAKNTDDDMNTILPSDFEGNKK